MRRNAFILSISLLTGLAVYILIFRNNTTLNPFTSDFSLSDPDKVTIINITDSEGTISLRKTEEGWKTGEVIILQEKAEDLLMLLHLLETRSPTPIEFEVDINACIDEGVKITCYQNKKVLKSFSLCKFNRALYARKQNTQRAYRISVRGYDNTDLTAIVTSRLQAWQQNSIIDLAATDIKLVSVHYPGTTKKGFILSVDSTGYLNLYNEKGMPVEMTLRDQRVKDYFYFFSGIRYFDAGKEFPDKRFIKNDSPFFILKIESWNSTVILIEGYGITDPETGKLNPEGFYAIHKKLGVIFLKYIDFDPILVDRDYFLKN